MYANSCKNLHIWYYIYVRQLINQKKGGGIMKVHKDLIESGLADLLKISNLTDNLDLAKFIGKKVRYKRKLLENSAFLKSVGTNALTEIYEVKQVQKDYKGDDVLRGYATVNFNDTFGRCLNVEDIELVKEVV